MQGGGFASAQDGSVEVDSNTGSAEELAAELATEVGSTDDAGRRIATPAQTQGVAEGDGDEEAEAIAGGAAKGEAGKPGGKKKSIQARIDELTRERYTTARERDAAAAERDELKRQLEALKAGKPADAAAKPDAAAAAATKVGGVSIDVEKFPKYAEWLALGIDGELEDWVDARDAWKEARSARTQAAEAARREHSQQFTQTAASFNERMRPVLEAEPEFYERIDPRLTETPAASALPPGIKPTFGNWLVEQVVRSSVPKELMEHLSKPKVIQRLMTLQPDEVLREIVRFELSLGEAGAKTGPSARATDDDDEEEEIPRRSAAAATATSRAQPPAKPVRGSANEHTSPDDEPGDDASDDDWFRWNSRKQAKASASA